MARAEMSINVTADLAPEAVALLTEIRDRLPSPQPAPAAVKASALAAAQRAALLAVLDALDGWIEGARENHGALEHRHENKGEECWRSFAPEDIRRMVNDAAREVGLKPFPYPNVPKEDTL